MRHVCWEALADKITRQTLDVTFNQCWVPVVPLSVTLAQQEPVFCVCCDIKYNEKKLTTERIYSTGFFHNNFSDFFSPKQLFSRWSVNYVNIFSILLTDKMRRLSSQKLTYFKHLKNAKTSDQNIGSMSNICWECLSYSLIRLK